MPMLRRRGGTCTPRSGAATSSPPIEIVPAVGCSRPAMQRNVVVLPQPEGPSSTTISPAAMRKLTSSTAGRPTANCLRKCETISSADIRFFQLGDGVRSSPRKRGPGARNWIRACAGMSGDHASLPVPVNLVPLLNPLPIQRLEFLELRQPHFRVLAEACRQQRRDFERGEIAVLLDAEDLPLLGELPFEI